MMTSQTLIGALLVLASLTSTVSEARIMKASDDELHGRRGTFALTNARIVTVTNGTVERGTVLIQGSRIIAVGADVVIPVDAEIIDCAGLTVYPGMIDAGTRLGISEVGSVAETNDYNEIGQINPHMDALTVVNPNSVLIPVTRVSGVTTVLTEPSGGRFPGTAALVNLHGYTPEQMLVGGVKPVILNFPSRAKQSSSDRRTKAKREEEYRKALKTLNEVWDRAVLYAQIDSAFHADPNRERKPEYAPEMEALFPVVRGEQRLIINADHAVVIEDAIAWARERDLLGRVILSGVLEGWRVAGTIASAGVPCLVGPVLQIPSRPYDRYDKAYANAGLLHAAGVKVAIRTSESENVRNLPFHAGFAAAYGLDRDEAMRAVTINAAEVFGVGDVVGSIEAGKLANLFVADGDPFETQTQIHHLFIAGYKLPLDNRQVRLYEEFIERRPGVDLHPTK